MVGVRSIEKPNKGNTYELGITFIFWGELCQKWESIIKLSQQNMYHLI